MRLKLKCKHTHAFLYFIFSTSFIYIYFIFRNPLAIASDGKLYCVDAKLNFDDCASYRQGDVFGMRDITMEDERELKAEDIGLNYISLDGESTYLCNNMKRK